MRLNRGVLVGAVIAFAIFAVIYLGIAAYQGSLTGGDAVVAIVGGLLCAAVATVIGGVAAGRATR